LTRKSKRGKLISFEGVEGSGKSTQARLLSEALRKRGLRTVLVKDPGSTKIGKRIKKLLLTDIADITELFLFLAARYQLVKVVIEPALSQGKIVIADRFTESTLAYQGGGRKMNVKLLQKLCKIASMGIKADLIILLDIDPKKGLLRVSSKRRLERIEKEPLEFHKRIRMFYKALAKNDTRFYIVDANLTPDVIHQKIMEKVGDVLSEPMTLFLGRLQNIKGLRVCSQKPIQML
jgi:dTMP kinase